MLIASLIASAFLACLAASLAWPTWPWPASIVLLSFLWVFVNKSVEGPLVWKLPDDMGGVTVSDLLALPCLLVGLLLLLRARKHRAAERVADLGSA
jgi:hypothetical protein